MNDNSGSSLRRGNALYSFHKFCDGGLASHVRPVQEVEYVKQEAKLPYLLECLQKTAPPVLIFAENKVCVLIASQCHKIVEMP